MINETVTVVASAFAPMPSAFETFWRWLTETHNVTYSLPLLAFVLHAITYILTCIPSWVIPLIPAAQKYKLQQKKAPPSKADVWNVAKLVFVNQVFIEFPLYFVLPVYLSWSNIPVTYDSMPALWTYIPKLLLSLIIEDTWHYWLHRALHHKSIYGYVHKVHHLYKSPFTMTAEYAHPIETIVLGTGFFVPMLLLCNHAIYLYLWFLVRMLEAADIHAGYDFPWYPMNFIPFYGGARAHDLHHAKFLGNYSSTFTWWDKWMGTELKEADPVPPAESLEGPTTLDSTKKAA